MATTGQVGDNPADFVKYVTGADISDALYKAVTYDPNNEGEVLEGTAGGVRFAGIIFSITAGWTPYGAVSGTTVPAPEGTRVGVVKSGFRPAKAGATIKYGDALGLGANGTLVPLVGYDLSPSAAMIVQFVGRAQEDADEGDQFIVNLDAS